jgi:hypothetical protein
VASSLAPSPLGLLLLHFARNHAASYQQRSLSTSALALSYFGQMGRPSMTDYHSIIAWAVSQLPSSADEARHAIYEQARTALHKRLGNDPQISDAELVNEHHRLEVAIYEVEEDLLLKDMRRFVREETGFISKIKEFVPSAWAKLRVLRH